MTTILVIEDEDSLRAEILTILSLENFQVLGAENGQVGLSMTQEKKPDLILCDMMMPELDGLHVLTLLRQNPETATIPFIFLTACAGREDWRRGMESGADDYLMKPFSVEELISAVGTCLKQKSDRPDLWEDSQQPPLV